MVQPWTLGVMTHLIASADALFARVREIGFEAMQLGYPPRDVENLPVLVAEVDAARQKHGVKVTTVFCGFEGESYADVPTVHRTVGLVPREPREQRLQKLDEISRFAADLNVPRIAAHIGAVPEDASDSLFGEVVTVLQCVCDALEERNQTFALETGQETVATLHRLIEEVNRPNLTVNFDPANMILYGNDDPTQALELLFPFIDDVHAKDGLWPTADERENGLIGREVPLGEGDVGFRDWLARLLEMGYRGPITIEREIEGDEQARDVRRAKELIEEVLQAQGLSA